MMDWEQQRGYKAGQGIPRLLVGLLVSAALLGSLGLQGYPQSKISGMMAVKTLYINDASNASVNLLTANDTKTTRLYGVSISSSSNENVKLKCGGNTLAGFHLGANGGVLQLLQPLYLECRAKATADLAGTIGTTSGSPTLTGTGTTFTQDFQVGDRVLLSNGEAFVITAITNNTTMTVATNASATQSTATHRRGADPLTLSKNAATSDLNVTLWYDQE